MGIELAVVDFDYLLEAPATAKITAAPQVNYFADIAGKKKISISDKQMDWLMTAVAYEAVMPRLLRAMKYGSVRSYTGRNIVQIYADECIPPSQVFTCNHEEWC